MKYVLTVVINGGLPTVVTYPAGSYLPIKLIWDNACARVDAANSGSYATLVRVPDLRRNKQ